MSTHFDVLRDAMQAVADRLPGLTAEQLLDVESWCRQLASQALIRRRDLHKSNVSS